MAAAVALSLPASCGAQSSDKQFEDVPPMILPPLRPLPELSFRGPFESDLHISGFDVAGQATRIATSPDFLRLSPPEPVAHGSIFSTSGIRNNEWIVEIALRMHGAGRAGSGQGGRGLAFWYTKAGSPMLGRSHETAFNEVSDASVSFFGQSTKFDGLGIIFDASPTAPVLPRSQPAGWPFGAHTSGVISALMDDGSAGSALFDDFKTGQKRDSAQEAKYIERAAGECEAAFRNAPGIVWARISNFNKEIRVDLDLQPHTTLSQEKRHYSHHCLTVKDIQLPAGYHFGLTALAGGNTEPDSIDVYAFDAWEVTGRADKKAAPNQAPPPVFRSHGETEPLAGTDSIVTPVDPMSMLAEVMISQNRMTEAIDALTRRVETMSSASHVSSQQGGNSEASNVARDASFNSQLENIQRQLSSLAGGAADRSAEELEQASISYLVTTLQQTLADVKGLAIRMDNHNSRLTSHLVSLSTRLADLVQLINTQADERRKIASTTSVFSGFASSAGKIVLLVGGIGLTGIAGLAGRKWWRNRDGSGFRGKKMI